MDDAYCVVGRGDYDEDCEDCEYCGDCCEVPGARCEKKACEDYALPGGRGTMVYTTPGTAGIDF